MTHHPSLFTLIDQWVIAFSFALMFTIVVGLLSAMTACIFSIAFCHVSTIDRRMSYIHHRCFFSEVANPLEVFVTVVWSVLAQNEHAFEWILTCYSKLHVLLSKCSKFDR